MYGSERCGGDSSDEADQEERDGDVWQKPRNTEVKIIDFGGATKQEEHHTSIINTRQYRAPEVMLSKGILNNISIGCQQWDMKSDIWSMACICAEIYTGEMFFSTHEDIEHLALIEKACGPFPKHMADSSTPKFKQCFDLGVSEDIVNKRGMRMDWPHCAKRKENQRNFNDMLSLNVKIVCLNYLVNL